MAIWPFGRRKRRVRPGSPQAVAQGAKPAGSQANPNPPLRVSRKLSKRGSVRRKTSSPRAQTLSKPDAGGPLKSSLSPVPPLTPMDTALDRRPPSAGSREDITALPNSRKLRTSPHLRPATQDNEGIPYNFHLPGSASHSSAPSASRGKLQRNPSRNKRAALESPLPRRKPSKKRKDDHVREEEIRAMSAPIPIPKRHGDSGLQSRDSKKFRDGLNRNFERPTSNISLPMEDSIHSSISAHSDSRNYRVSLLDVVAPRPTLRYSLNTPYVSAGMSQNNWNTSTRAESRRSQKRPFPGKDVLKESRTIDALADDLDAKELREILERDNRRRERKQKTDAERLQRRLERKAEKERRKEFRAQEQATAGADDSTETAKDTERPAVTGLGIDSRDQAMPMPDLSRKPPIPEKSQERLRRANVEAQSPQSESPFETPFETPMEISVSTTARPTTHPSTDASPPASPSRVESRTDTVPSQPSSFPQSFTSEPTPPPSAPRRDSGNGSKRGGLWSSLFRRDPNRRKSSADRGKELPKIEASFINTSRDSMSRQIPPSHLYQPPSQSSSQSRSKSDTPARTQSRFREELPEMPLSPPDSRVHSPEATTTAARAIAARRGYKVPAVQTDVLSGQRVSSPSDEPTSQGRTDSPVSGRGSNLMSQSLASIDSEGSWLSGKAMNRLSSTARKYHSGGSSSAARLADEFSGSTEELGVHDDEYFRRLTPQPGEVRRSSGLSASALGHKASSNAMVPDDDDDGLDTDEELQSSPPRARRDDDDAHTVVHSVVGRQPTVVHRDIRVKSSEGLLNQYNEPAAEAAYNTPPASPKKVDRGASESNGDGETPGDEAETHEAAPVQRASSVKVGRGGGHVRQISAGSAKLLDIPKRSSQSSSRATSAGPPTPKPGVDVAWEESKS